MGATGSPSEQLLQLLLAYNASRSEGPLDETRANPAPDNKDNPYELSWWVQMTYATAFGAMLAVATVGNAIVIWAVLNHHAMRSPTNYFLVNVSLADLMMATFNAMFNFAYMLHNNWPFGGAYCTVNNFVANLTVALSVFSLTAICVDRYVAIMKPLRPHMTKRVAVMTIVGIWLAGGLLSLPNLLYSTTIAVPQGNATFSTACILKWPDGVNVFSKQDYAYNVVFMAVTYVLPISAMSFAYLQMGRELWGSTWIGECCDKQVANIKSKRKVVCMFIVVVTIFAICWLPYHIYFIYVAHHNDAMRLPYIQHVYLAFYWLAMSSSMYNPIIYVTMNARFRQYFLTVLRCCRPQPPRSGRGYSMSGSKQSMMGRHSFAQSTSERHVTLKQTSADRARTTNGHQVVSCPVNGPLALNPPYTGGSLPSSGPKANGQPTVTLVNGTSQFKVWFRKQSTEVVTL